MARTQYLWILINLSIIALAHSQTTEVFTEIVTDLTTKPVAISTIKTDAVTNAPTRVATTELNPTTTLHTTSPLITTSQSESPPAETTLKTDAVTDAVTNAPTRAPTTELNPTTTLHTTSPLITTSQSESPPAETATSFLHTTSSTQVPSTAKVTSNTDPTSKITTNTDSTSKITTNTHSTSKATSNTEPEGLTNMETDIGTTVLEGTSITDLEPKSTSKSQTEPGVTTKPTTTEKDGDSEPLSAGEIAGITVGAIAGVALIAGSVAIVVYFMKRTSTSVKPADSHAILVGGEEGGMGHSGIEMTSAKELNPVEELEDISN